jgi:hypothetical protein
MRNLCGRIVTLEDRGISAYTEDLDILDGLRWAWTSTVPFLGFDVHGLAANVVLLSF